jgi:hypothetical protein
MSWCPNTSEEWSAAIGVLVALTIALKKYRNERRQRKMETCPAHLQLDNRMEKSEKDQEQIKETLIEHGQSIAVTVALLKDLKEDVQENRRVVTEKLDDVTKSIVNLSLLIARGNGGIKL